jgi:hypothetical protein
MMLQVLSSGLNIVFEPIRAVFASLIPVGESVGVKGADIFGIGCS